MENTKEEKSLHELMFDAAQLSWECAYSEISPDDTFLTPREDGILTDEEADLIYGYADGLEDKYLDKMMSCRCSLASMRDFDIGQYEENVKSDIQKMQKILDRIGKPIQLTFEMMKTRGYHVSDHLKTSN